MEIVQALKTIQQQEIVHVLIIMEHVNKFMEHALKHMQHVSQQQIMHIVHQQQIMQHATLLQTI